MKLSWPSFPMLARVNDDGVSVNESAICSPCLQDADEWVLESSYDNWINAEDVSGAGSGEFYPVDNPDAVCNGCGARTLWERG